MGDFVGWGHVNTILLSVFPSAPAELFVSTVRAVESAPCHLPYLSWLPWQGGNGKTPTVLKVKAPCTEPSSCKSLVGVSFLAPLHPRRRPLVANMINAPLGLSHFSPGAAPAWFISRCWWVVSISVFRLGCAKTDQDEFH